MRNIAITGAMGSGKSSIAAILINRGYTKVSFAQPLRDVAALAYGAVEKGKDYEVSDKDGNTSEISGRAILQRVGQSIKSMDNLFWTKVFTRNADMLSVPLVTDDLRFSHEFDAVRERGWLTVGLECPMSVRIDRLTAVNGRPPTFEELSHESEREVPGLLNLCDLVVDSTLDPYVNAAKILELVG